MAHGSAMAAVIGDCGSLVLQRFLAECVACDHCAHRHMPLLASRCVSWRM